MLSIENVNQQVLYSVVRAIFTDHDVKINSRKITNITNPSTGKYLEVDVWVPALSIGFEFQDPYHYTTSWESHETLLNVQFKDTLKNETIKEKGETLIIVPYWWNGSRYSLQATINFYRPDLLREDRIKPHQLISLNPKVDHTVGIPHVGALMLASFPTTRFEESISPENGWWLGEKYDGVRFCWNPITRSLFSRSAANIEIRESFYAWFPNSFLDGELWFGRGGFQDSQRLVLSVPTSTTWMNFRSVIFDDPDPSIEYIPFEKRYEKMLYALNYNHPFIIPAVRLLAKSHKKLKLFIEDIMKDGGEGVILRKPASIYERGRSPMLYKLKASRGDREALVVHDQGSFLTLQLPDGVVFEVPKDKGTQDFLKPKKGDIVTFTYDKYSRREAPVNAAILRVRKDVSWENVVNDYLESVPQSQTLGDSSTKLGGFTAQPSRYWSQGGKNMRLFLENRLKEKGLDPLLPSTWYDLKRSDIEAKGLASMLAAYNGSLVKAVVDLFPELGLDTSKFYQLPKRYWHDIGNRRKFFEEYAKEKGFNPLSADGWYSIQISDFLKYKSSNVALYFHSKHSQSASLVKTLREIFPEVVFDDTKFAKTPTQFLKDYFNRRQAFEKFALENKFDPFISTNWYSIPTKSILASKAISAVARHYEGSISRALIHLFPDIGLEAGKFPSSPNKYWMDYRNRRGFFEDLAKQKHFDPLMVANWYPFTTKAIVSKGGAPVLRYYNTKSVAEALVDLFPEIRFDVKQFHAN